MNQESLVGGSIGQGTATVTKTRDRLSRFQRDPGVLPFQYQSTDDDFLKALAKFRFLRTSHLRLLLPSRGQQGILRRLQKLYHTGYVDRLFDDAELLFYRQNELGTPETIYALGTQGAKRLGEEYGYPMSRWDWNNRRIGAQNIQHNLMVTNFFLTLFVAHRSQPNIQLILVAEQLRKLFEEEETLEETERQARYPHDWFYTGRHLKSPKPLDFVFKYMRKRTKPDGQVQELPAQRKMKASFYPDGFFAIRDESRPAGRNRMFFFLEADNQTMTITKRMRPKFLAHWAYQQLKPNPLQIPNMRILHVSRTRRRVTNLLNFTRKLHQDGNIGGRFHWFCSQQDFSLEEPDKLFEEIWQVPGDERKHSLLE